MVIHVADYSTIGELVGGADVGEGAAKSSAEGRADDLPMTCRFRQGRILMRLQVACSRRGSRC